MRKLVKSNLHRLMALFIAVVLLFGFFYYRNHHSQPKSTLTPKTTSAVSNSIKYNSAPSTSADNAANETRKSSGATSSTLENNTSTNKNTSLSLTVTGASVDSANQNLRVSALVYGTTGGTCTVNVSQSGQSTVTDSGPVTQQANYYSCPVFYIPLSRFSNRGNWNVSVSLSSPNGTTSGDWANNPVSLSN